MAGSGPMGPPGEATGMKMDSKTTARLLGACAAATVLAGCSLTEFRPGGNMRSDDQFTYMSTPDLPVSVDLVDIRDNTIVWSIDVPLGQKLTMRFYEDGARDGSPNASDVMKWQIYDSELTGTFLRNKIVVPPMTARRLDVTYRDAPEYFAAPGNMPPPPFDPLPAVPREGAEAASVTPASPVSRSSMPVDGPVDGAVDGAAGGAGDGAAGGVIEVEDAGVQPHQVEIVEP